VGVNAVPLQTEANSGADEAMMRRPGAELSPIPLSDFLVRRLVSAEEVGVP